VQQKEALLTSVTAGGNVWVPRFVQSINQNKCLGCGRCFKVCGRDVLMLVSIERDDDDDERMAMSIKNRSLCIGCEACQRTCPKKCFTHSALSAA